MCPVIAHCLTARQRGRLRKITASRGTATTLADRSVGTQTGMFTPPSSGKSCCYRRNCHLTNFAMTSINHRRLLIGSFAAVALGLSPSPSAGQKFVNGGYTVSLYGQNDDSFHFAERRVYDAEGLVMALKKINGGYNLRAGHEADYVQPYEVRLINLGWGDYLIRYVEQSGRPKEVYDGVMDFVAKRPHMSLAKSEWFKTKLVPMLFRNRPDLLMAFSQSQLPTYNVR